MRPWPHWSKLASMSRTDEDAAAQRPECGRSTPRAPPDRPAGLRRRCDRPGVPHVEQPAQITRSKIPRGGHPGQVGPARSGHPAIAPAAAQAAQPAVRAAGGEPGRDRTAARRLPADARPFAPGARRTAADPGAPAVGGDRRHGGGKRDRGGIVALADGASRATTGGPGSSGGRGARDRAPAGAQPDPRAVPQLLRRAAGLGPGRPKRCARPMPP